MTQRQYYFFSEEWLLRGDFFLGAMGDVEEGGDCATDADMVGEERSVGEEGEEVEGEEDEDEVPAPSPLGD